MSTRRTTRGARQGRGAQDAGVPRWVKVFAAAAIALLLVGVAVMLLSGGEHGPGRHTSSVADLSVLTPIAAAAAGPGDSTAGRPAQVVLR